MIVIVIARAMYCNCNDTYCTIDSYSWHLQSALIREEIPHKLIYSEADTQYTLFRKLNQLRP